MRVRANRDEARGGGVVVYSLLMARSLARRLVLCDVRCQNSQCRQG